MAGPIPGAQEELGRGRQLHKTLEVTGFHACRCTPVCPSLCWSGLFSIINKTGAKGVEVVKADEGGGISGLSPELAISGEGTLLGAILYAPLC